MIVEEDFESAAGGLRLRERGQPGLNVFSHGLPGLIPGLVERQMFNRPQRTTLTVCPGHDPSLVPRWLHAKDQTTNLSVPELIGAISGLRRENNALRERG